MPTDEYKLIEEMAKSTRNWRDRALEGIAKDGLSDLSYRPRSGMSSLGWLIGHQGAGYDFSLNVLILGGSSSRPETLKKFVPGTSGDWDGTPLEEMLQYYDSSEHDFLAWAESTTTEELDRIVDRKEIPQFFRGMTVRQIISHLFVHLNHHNGQLLALKRDWLGQ